MGHFQMVKNLLFVVFAFQLLTINVAFSQQNPESIFVDLVQLKPIVCYQATVDGRDVIIGFANSGEDPKGKDNFYSNPEIFSYKLLKFANSWQIESKTPICNTEYTYVELHNNFEKVKIKDNIYIYFTYKVSNMGNAVNTIDLVFTLVSPKTNHATELIYSGEPEYDNKGKLTRIKGQFETHDDNIPVDLFSFLENMASKSSLIYRPTSKDTDINDPINFEKKWTIDNGKLLNSKYNNIEQKIIFTYYPNNLLDPEDSEVIENPYYKAYYYWRYGVIGYNKTKQKYFPIYINGCAHGCESTITWAKDHIIKISPRDSNGRNFIAIDLKNCLYMAFEK